jgi:amidophosphoribosyltransferase
MATKTEFIAAGRTPAEVAAALEADYVLYLEREAMNEAARAGNPKVERFCNACFSGEYPTGDITSDVLDRIGNERVDSRQKLFSFSP